VLPNSVAVSWNTPINGYTVPLPSLPGFSGLHGREGIGRRRERKTRDKKKGGEGTEEGRRNSALVVGGIEPRLLFVANLYLT